MFVGVSELKKYTDEDGGEHGLHGLGNFLSE